MYWKYPFCGLNIFTKAHRAGGGIFIPDVCLEKGCYLTIMNVQLFLKPAALMGSDFVRVGDVFTWARECRG